MLTILVATLLGAGMAVAGSAGGLRVGGVPVFAICAALAFGINWVAFVPAYLARTERFYDLTGTLSYLTVVVVALLAGSGSSSTVLLAVLVAIWAVRLGTFLVLRIRKDVRTDASTRSRSTPCASP